MKQLVRSIPDLKATVDRRIETMQPQERVAYLKRAVALMDLTVLACSSTKGRIEELAVTADQYGTAAVCVNPAHVAVVSAKLHALGADGRIKIASVAGGFPLALIPLDCKVREIKRAVADGADEIDIVLSPSWILDRDFRTAAREIRAMVAAAGGKPVKVILETSELPTPSDGSEHPIVTASKIAIANGATFIKTSTGFASGGASFEAVALMLQVIGLEGTCRPDDRLVGMKPSGGIKKGVDALRYLLLAEEILGPEYAASPEFFRFGASSLLPAIVAELYSFLGMDPFTGARTQGLDGRVMNPFPMEHEFLVPGVLPDGIFAGLVASELGRYLAEARQLTGPLQDAAVRRVARFLAEEASFSFEQALEVLEGYTDSGTFAQSMLFFTPASDMNDPDVVRQVHGCFISPELLRAFGAFGDNAPQRADLSL